MAKSVATSAGQSPDQIENVMLDLQTALMDCCHVSAGLAIGTTTTKVKIAAAVKLLINGVLVTKAITDDCYTLAGSVTNAKFNVFVMTLNASGTAVALMGTEAATLAAIVWPVIPSGSVVIGYVIINPTGTGPFVGGTTALTDATVVPNAVYVNTPFPFNPNALTLPNDN